MADQHTGTTRSVWMDAVQFNEAAPLLESEHCDTCIAGAGIAGLTTAYLLAKEGRKVLVVNDGPLCNGETERTTAHLASAIDDRYFELERMHGAKGSQLAYQSHSRAIDKIEEIVRSEQIECGFSRLDGYLFLGSDDDSSLLQQELEAAHRAGFSDVTLEPHPPIQSLSNRQCLKFPNQGQFHPLQYLSALASAIGRLGGRFANAHIEAVESKGGTVTLTATGGAKITAGAAVIATNSPISSFVSIHTKQSAYRSYVIAVQIPAGSVPRALYWDTPDPYHYVRLQDGSGENGDEILIVGGEDHKTGQADDMEDRYARLEAWTRQHFPMAGTVVNRWSGQVQETNDGVAFIGKAPSGEENVYIATGDSGMGMTHGTIAGILITDLILGRSNDWETLYDPSRKSLSVSAAREWVKENVNVAAQYRELVTPGEIQSVEELKPGEAAILRRGTAKIAVSRDENGQLHERSAVCTHLGCIVHWNPNEKSWDCPCHGSRFNPDGGVLSGPAISPLKDFESSVFPKQDDAI